MPEQAEFVDGDDYTWQGPAGDLRTADQKTSAAIADLQSAVAVLTDEVRHLREDVARMRAGESEL